MREIVMEVCSNFKTESYFLPSNTSERLVLPLQIINLCFS